MNITPEEQKIIEILRSMRENEKLTITKEPKKSPYSFVAKLETLILVDKVDQKKNI